MLRSLLIVVPMLLLASCASTSTRNTQTSYGAMQDTGAGGAAPVTHEPYGSEMREFQTHSPDQIKWKDGPASLPAGAQMAVLEGDPTKEGPFVFRLKLPSDYTIAPHMHPRAARLTVIAGTFNIAEGESVNKTAGKAKVMPAGTFGYWPARMHHFAWTSGETIIQLHGLGPWQIEYLNPADDPRKSTK